MKYVKYARKNASKRYVSDFSKVIYLSYSLINIWYGSLVQIHFFVSKTKDMIHVFTGVEKNDV